MSEGHDGTGGGDWDEASDEADDDLPSEELPPEDLPPAEVEYHTALPPKVEAWRQRSATGAILTGLALGLQQALETKPEEPHIVVQTSGDPPRDLPVEADFEYRRPRQSVVNVRPWLLDEVGSPRAAADDDHDADPDAAPSENPGDTGGS